MEEKHKENIDTLLNKGRKERTQTDQTINIEEYIQTMITFDKGGIWSPLKAPFNDVNGDKIFC